jgi:hypothetical protein
MGSAAINAAALDSAPQAKTEQVQWRRGWRSGPRRHYHRRHYRGPGPGVGLGLGLATGAIIGGAIASQQAQAAQNAHAYCAQRFRSYDPASGTYLGYDGYRHPCP